MNKKNYYLFLLFSSLTVLLNSCTGGPALIGFPYDPGGRSLNSPGSDTNGQISGRYIVLISDRRGSQDVYLFDV
ncbi:MAG TPA: Tol biopolymer transporter periplasmic protein, partial [Allocoleopsis sp.]